MEYGGDADGRCVVEAEATDETKSSGAAVAADYTAKAAVDGPVEAAVTKA